MALFRRRQELADIASPASVDHALVFFWQRSGSITLRSGRLVFPKPSPSPGLYRFRFRDSRSARVYIGESKNVNRRFNNYAQPGPTQSTNIRINAEMVSHLTSGGAIDVDTCFEVRFGSPKPRKLDLLDTAARRLAENAAIVVAKRSNDKLLNR